MKTKTAHDDSRHQQGAASGNSHRHQQCLTSIRCEPTAKITPKVMKTIIDLQKGHAETYKFILEEAVKYVSYSEYESPESRIDLMQFLWDIAEVMEKFIPDGHTVVDDDHLPDGMPL